MDHQPNGEKKDPEPHLQSAESEHTKRYIVVIAFIVTVLFLFDALTAGIPDPHRVMEVPADAVISAGDTAWVTTASAMVMLMTPGLAFFYGGMVRPKSIISTLMQSVICLGIITVIWIVYGFSLCFGTVRGNGVIATPRTYAFYSGVGAAPNPTFSATIPFGLYSMFQLYFAVITPALISGALSERVKFDAYCVFVILWFTTVYCPLACMVWNPHGLLFQWGVLDFAGGAVVHMSSGISALVGAWVVGPSLDKDKKAPANIPFVILGTAMLWFGWIGFNAGSALSAGGLSVQAFINTNAGAASSMLTWLLVDQFKGRKVSAISGCSGAVVGLVLVTPACGFVTVGGALCIGAIGSVVCNLVSHAMKKVGDLDDSLDVFPCHGMGGIMGCLLTGCFAHHSINPIAMDGLFYGGTVLIWRHIVTIILLTLYIAFMSFLMFKIVDLTIGLRVSAMQEAMGVDRAFHGEKYHSVFRSVSNAVLMRGPKQSSKGQIEHNLHADGL